MEAEEFDKKNRRVAEEYEMKYMEKTAESPLLLKDWEGSCLNSN